MKRIILFVLMALMMVGVYSYDSVSQEASMTIETKVKEVFKVKIAEADDYDVKGFDSSKTIKKFLVVDDGSDDVLESPSYYLLVKTNLSSTKASFITVSIKAVSMENEDTDSSFLIHYRLEYGPSQSEMVSTKNGSTKTFNLGKGEGLRVIPTEFQIIVLSPDGEDATTLEFASAGKYIETLTFNVTTP